MAKAPKKAPPDKRVKPDVTEPHPSKPGWYHKEMLANLLNLSVRRLEQLAQDGTVPKIVRAYLPLVETVNSYVKFLQQTNKGRQPAGAASEQSLAVARERERKLKMENDFREGQLIELSIVDALVTEMASMLANQLDGAAGRMSGGDAVLRKRLLNEHRRIRDTYAKGLQSICTPEQGSKPDTAATG